jgi:hypothetical protein
MVALDPTLTAPTVTQPVTPDASLRSLGTPQMPYDPTNMVGTTVPDTTAYGAVSGQPSPLQVPNPQNGNASQNDSTNTGSSDPNATNDTNSPANRTLGAIESSLPTDEQSYENTILGTYQARQAATQQGSAAAAQGIENQSNEDIYYQNQENQNEQTSMEESRRGFATNTAMFQQLQDTGQKRIRDLEKQRDDYLLQNDQNNADQINQLIIGEQTAITTARQNYYSNMFQTLTGEQNQQQFEYGKTPTQRLNALAQVRQSLFYSGASPDELNMIDQLIQQTATGGGVSNPTGGSSDTGQTTASTTRALSNAPTSAAAVNNPLGLKPGGTFAQFPDGNSGFQAGVSQINEYLQGQGPVKSINSNSTLQQFVNTWVNGDPNKPAQGYNADEVAQYLTQNMGIKNVTANTPLYQLGGAQNIAAAIAHFETGYDSQSSSFPGGAAASGSGSTATLQSYEDEYTQQLQNGTPPSQIQATISGSGIGPMQNLALQQAMQKYYAANPSESIGESNINYQSILNASQDVSDQAANRLVTIKKVTTATNELLTLSDQFKRSGITNINQAWLTQARSGKFGPTVANQAADFNEASQIIADDIGNVFASGGAITDAKLQFATNLVNQNYSPDELRSQIGTLNTFLGLQSTAYNQVLSNPTGLGIGRSLNGGSTSSSSSGSGNSLATQYPAGTVVTYQGQQYTVDAQGNMTPVSQ